MLAWNLLPTSSCRVGMWARSNKWSAPTSLSVKMAKHHTTYLANAASLAVSIFVNNVHACYDIIRYPHFLFSAVYSSRFFGGNTSQPRTGGGDAIPTPIANTWTEWSGWTECSKTCEEGRQSRMRSCITEGQSILDCSGRRVDIRSCNEHHCPGENGTIYMLVWITQHLTFHDTNIINFAVSMSITKY